MIASHYEINLEPLCEGYVLADEPELADAEMRRLNDVVEGPRTSLARHFEVEAVPPPQSPTAVVPPTGPPSRRFSHRLAGIFGIFVNCGKDSVDSEYQVLVVCCVVIFAVLCLLF